MGSEGFWKDVGNSILASATISSTMAAAVWGAFGGATSALTVRVDRKAMVRQVLLGALVAGGSGTAGFALFAATFGLDSDVVLAGGTLGSVSYITGAFGPAIVEAILGKISGGTRKEEPKK